MTSTTEKSPINTASPVTKTSKVELQRGESLLTGTVALCSWMYDGYPFQTSVHLSKNGGSVQIRDKKLTFNEATVGDMERMLSTVHLQTCTSEGCNNAAFDPLFAETNREGQCEACFMTKLNADFQAAQDQERQRLLKLDAEHKAKGNTHRVDAWIHNDHGDDQFVSWWMKNPTADQVKAEIKKQGSCVLDDYSITVL